MNRYTVFCMESDRTGTTYITAIDAEGPQAAKREALAECAREWDMDADQIDVIGLAAGDVQILEWDDEVSLDVDADDAPAMPADAYDAPVPYDNAGAYEVAP